MPIANPSNSKLFDAISQAVDWSKKLYRENVPSSVRRNISDIIDTPMPGNIAALGKGSFQIADSLMDAAPVVMGMMPKLGKLARGKKADLLMKLLQDIAYDVEKFENPLGGGPYNTSFITRDPDIKGHAKLSLGDDVPTISRFASEGESAPTIEKFPLNQIISSSFVKNLDPGFSRVNPTIRILDKTAADKEIGSMSLGNYLHNQFPADTSLGTITARSDKWDGMKEFEMPVSNLYRDINVLAHELQHGIQHLDNPGMFDDYTTPISRDHGEFMRYFNHPSEVEARQAGEIAEDNFKQLYHHINLYRDDLKKLHPNQRIMEQLKEYIAGGGARKNPFLGDVIPLGRIDTRVIK